jgi:hypothetical protein
MITRMGEKLKKTLVGTIYEGGGANNGFNEPVKNELNIRAP